MARDNYSWLPDPVLKWLATSTCSSCRLNLAIDNVTGFSVRTSTDGTAKLAADFACPQCGTTGYRPIHGNTEDLLKVHAHLLLRLRKHLGGLFSAPSGSTAAASRGAPAQGQGTRPHAPVSPPRETIGEVLARITPAGLSPRWLREQLVKRGYCGIGDNPQTDDVVREACLLAYDHLRRLHAIHVQGLDSNELPPKRNMLIAGPTGSGKTYLASLLFEQVLGLPCLVQDCTTLTSAGYVGEDVVSIPAALIRKAGGNVALAECGVVVLDEIDKLGKSGGNDRNWLKSSVQHELLRFLQGGEVTASFAVGYAQTNRDGGELRIRTDNIAFIGCGAFAGIEAVLAARRRSTGGGPQQPAGPVTAEDLTPEVLGRYFIPELIGRFATIAALPPITPDALRQIAAREIKKERKRWELEGRLSQFDALAGDGRLEQVAEDACRRGTGARGVTAALGKLFSREAFDLFAWPPSAADQEAAEAASKPLGLGEDCPEKPVECPPVERTHYNWRFVFTPAPGASSSWACEVARVEIEPPASMLRSLMDALGIDRVSQVLEMHLGRHRLTRIGNMVVADLSCPSIVHTTTVHKQIHRDLVAACRGGRAA